MIDRGDLVTALRASVSAPGIFAPVEREGRLLVDGGIAKNLPVDIARAMGVDVLIVVDVGFPLSTREQLRSVASVSNQMLAIRIRREREKQRALQATGRHPDQPALQRTSSRAQQAARTVALGEAAGREVEAQLRLQSWEYGALYGSRSRVRRRRHRVRARRCGIAGYAAPVAALFGDPAGMPLDPRDLQTINRYYGQGVLETLDYRLETQDRTRCGPHGPDIYCLMHRDRTTCASP